MTGTRYGGAIVALALALLVLLGSTEAKQAGNLKNDIDEIADAIAKNQPDTLKKKAAAVANAIDEVGDVMNLLLLRRGNKGGIGVGPKPEEIRPDGMDQKIADIATKGISQVKLKKEAKALERMAHRTAAILEVAQRKPLATLNPQQVKQWQELAKESRAATLELAKAIREGAPPEVGKAAVRTYATCDRCHTLFKGKE
jgi:hypothetical protein